MQAQDLINDAGKTLAVLQSGETFNSDELADALVLLNYMLENWNTQGLEVFSVTNFTEPLIANQTTPYTIGTGGAINTNRPVKIQSAGIIQSSGVRTPLDLISSKEYATILSKADVSLVPTRLYNDNAFPLANLFLHPWASGTPTLDLWMWAQMDENFTLTTTLGFPPGYYLALRYNLAEQLIAMFPRALDGGLQVVLDQAKSLKAELMGVNASNMAASEMPPPPPQPAR